jgi:hypothetical protein
LQQQQLLLQLQQLLLLLAHALLQRRLGRAPLPQRACAAGPLVYCVLSLLCIAGTLL